MTPIAVPAIGMDGREGKKIEATGRVDPDTKRLIIYSAFQAFYFARPRMNISCV